MAQSKALSALGVIGDTVIVVAFCLCSFLLHFEPHHRGFFKDDESLMYPHKSSIVQHNVLYGVGFGLPTAFIFVVEGIRAMMKQKKSKTEHSRFSVWLWNVYRLCLMFYLGMAVTRFTTNMAKALVGRLRPYFFDVCKPDMSALDSLTYLQGDLCTGTEHKVAKARVSFPSGHSSISSYGMFFIVIYLQKRLTWKGMVVIKPLFQVVCLLMAIFCCLSRITDNHHHPFDVLAGATLGVLVAVLMYWSIGKSCLPSKESNSIDHGDLDQVTIGSFQSGGTTHERGFPLY